MRLRCGATRREVSVAAAACLSRGPASTSFDDRQLSDELGRKRLTPFDCVDQALGNRGIDPGWRLRASLIGVGWLVECTGGVTKPMRH